jgi:hypothetical protein
MPWLNEPGKQARSVIVSTSCARLHWKPKCFTQWISCQIRRASWRIVVRTAWSATSLPKLLVYGPARIRTTIRFVRKLYIRTFRETKKRRILCLCGGAAQTQNANFSTIFGHCDERSSLHRPQGGVRRSHLPARGDGFAEEWLAMTAQPNKKAAYKRPPFLLVFVFELLDLDDRASFFQFLLGVHGGVLADCG